MVTAIREVNDRCHLRLIPVKCLWDTEIQRGKISTKYLQYVQSLYLDRDCTSQIYNYLHLLLKSNFQLFNVLARSCGHRVPTYLKYLKFQLPTFFFKHTVLIEVVFIFIQFDIIFLTHLLWYNFNGDDIFFPRQHTWFLLGLSHGF
jgi:hypothetical protein